MDLAWKRENNTVLSLSPHSVPLTPCSISLVPLWAHCEIPLVLCRGVEWEGCEIQSGVIYSQEETMRAPKGSMPTECPLKSKRTGSAWKEGKDQVWRDWSCLSYRFLQGIKHMHQNTQVIIIRSIPSTDTDLDLVWWFWFNDPLCGSPTVPKNKYWLLLERFLSCSFPLFALLLLQGKPAWLAGCYTELNSEMGSSRTIFRQGMNKSRRITH